VKRAGSFAAALAAGLLLPELALASGGEEAGHGWERFWEWANLLLLVAALVYFGRKPIASFLADRRGGIERDLNGAEQLLRDAEGRLAEWSARAARLDEEVADIKRVAREAAEQDAARIVAEAKAVAERIRRDASAAVVRESQRARLRLRQEAADLAVKSAERVLVEQVQPADGDRLFEELVARIEQAPAAPGRS
jgi:F-type H+-transporting ATPase subunit b